MKYPLPRLRKLCAVAVASAALASTSGASAATLGGITSGALSGYSVAQASGAPTVLVWDNFDGPNGQVLAGTGTNNSVPLTWTATGCAWTVSSNQAANAGTNSCALRVNATPAFNRSSGTTLTRNGTAWDCGVILNSNAAMTQFISAEWTSNSNGSLEIWAYNGGWTNLVALTNMYASPAAAPASIDLRMTSQAGGVLRAYIDGVEVLTTTLSAANQTTFYNTSHTYFGIFGYFDATSRFNDFHLDTP
jgi:hypothetical protein